MRTGPHKINKDQAEKLADTTRDRIAGLYFAQRTTIAIQRGNAARILGTLPSGEGMDRLGYLSHR